MVVSSLGAYLLNHPSLISFHYEHGINLDDTTTWSLDWLRNPHSKIISENPLNAMASIELDGEVLDIVVGEELEVIETMKH